jgi:hypothetical protein
MKPALLLIAVLCAGLAGCEALELGGPPPVAGVSQREVAGGKFIAIVAPRRQYAAPFLGVAGTNIDVLRSWIDRRTGEEASQLYVEASYTGAERNYQAAQEASGEALRFVPISKNEITCDNGCSYAEEFGAVLPTAVLRAHPGGLTVSFTAKSGPPLTVGVPGEAVQQQLAALDAARATVPAAASPR